MKSVWPKRSVQNALAMNGRLVFYFLDSVSIDIARIIIKCRLR